MVLNETDGNELSILNEISKRTLVKLGELSTNLNMDKDSVMAIVRNLISKGLVMSVAPAGETSYVLTQKGVKSLQNA